jgi:hypothetical protein
MKANNTLIHQSIITSVVKKMFKKVLLNKDIGNEDLTAQRNEYHFPLPQFLIQKILPMLNDPRDIICCHLIFNIFCITIPLSIFWLFFLPRNLTTTSLVICILVVSAHYILFLTRFILMFHFHTHKPIFKQEYNYLNYMIPYFLSPFFGFMIGLYGLHHAVMHHQENNSRLDITETETYQRDSKIEYLKYQFAFMIGFFLYLPIYALIRKRYLLALNHVVFFFLFAKIYLFFHSFNPVGNLIFNK